MRLTHLAAAMMAAALAAGCGRELSNEDVPADFGSYDPARIETRALTRADIAAFDVAGIQPGMTQAEAEAALEALGQGHRVFFEDVSRQDLDPGWHETSSRSRGGRDGSTLSLTRYLDADGVLRVYEVTRLVAFEAPRSPDDTVDGIVAQYGAPASIAPRFYEVDPPQANLHYVAAYGPGLTSQERACLDTDDPLLARRDPPEREGCDLSAEARLDLRRRWIDHIATNELQASFMFIDQTFRLRRESLRLEAIAIAETRREQQIWAEAGYIEVPGALGAATP